MDDELNSQQPMFGKPQFDLIFDLIVCIFKVIYSNSMSTNNAAEKCLCKCIRSPTGQQMLSQCLPLLAQKEDNELWGKQ